MIEAHGLLTPAAEGLRHLPLVEPEGGHRIRPLGRPVVLQIIERVLDEERLDVGDVLPDPLIVRTPAQGHERPGDDVDEAPGKFAEGGTITLGGELIGDPSGGATSVMRANSPTAL